jgi:hypothetical protein
MIIVLKIFLSDALNSFISLNFEVLKFSTMNYRITIAMLLAIVFFACQTNEEKRATTGSRVDLRFDQNETVTYYEAVDFYQKLSDQYPEAQLLTYGMTDAGKPLHLFVMSKDGNFDPGHAKKTGKSVLLVNNGIHPGEPEGIDASIWFADDVLRNHNGMFSLLDNSVICIIPVYNIGGCLNRSAFHRTGQTTPKACGYRGNAKNLDLNRDFVKMDTKNARAFAEIFHTWNPHTFLDTHTTNGSDHKYVITLIPYQPDALPQPLSGFYREQLIPHLYNYMSKTGYELIPYVTYLNESPKSGIALDPQQPRFSTGYTGLFNTLGFMTENHIYKPFPDRVRSVYHFLNALAGFTNERAGELVELCDDAGESVRRQKEFVIGWKPDTAQFRMIRFQGYEGEVGISPLTGLERFGFNREKPYDTMVPYFAHHLPAKTITAPDYYILPSAWEDVVENLKMNKVEMLPLKTDTIIRVEQYHISDVETQNRQYNWHRYHYNFKIETITRHVQFFEGDYLIPMDQVVNKYVVEMLEPEAEDSFFRWNFFDPILESREYYSSYGFEENAMKYLDEHPEFKRQFQEAVKSDPELAKNHRAQLGYIYENTEWADNRVGRYPVARVTSNNR